MKTNLFIAILAFQITALLAIIIPQEAKRRTAPTALVATVPVDPRDLLRGDYVQLRYAFSRLDPAMFQTADRPQLRAGGTVWVVLEKHGRFHEIVSASLSKPVLKKDQLAIQGRTADSGSIPGTSPMGATFGLERFYVREGTGTPSGTLSVEISVPDSGTAIIKQVYVNDRPYADAMREIHR